MAQQSDEIPEVLCTLERAIEELMKPHLKPEYIGGEGGYSYYEIRDVPSSESDLSFPPRCVNLALYTAEKAETDQPIVEFIFTPGTYNHGQNIFVSEVKAIAALGERLESLSELNNKGLVADYFEVNEGTLEMYARYSGDLFLNDARREEANKVISEVKGYLCK